MQVWLSHKQGISDKHIEFFEAISKNRDAHRRRAIKWYEDQYGVEYDEMQNCSNDDNSDDNEDSKEDRDSTQPLFIPKFEESKRLPTTTTMNNISEESKSDNSGDGSNGADSNNEPSEDSFVSTDSDYDIYSTKNDKLQKHEPTIRKMMNAKYIYNLLKMLRIIMLLCLIMITVIGVSFKGNLYSIFSLMALVPLVFKELSYNSIKQYNCFLILLSILEYVIALTNISAENSPMEYPIPFNPDLRPYEDSVLPIPWYTKISYFDSYPDWSYYLGCTETQRARSAIWYEWSCMLICCIYFTVFNSVIVDKNLDINVKQSIISLLEQDEAANDDGSNKNSRKSHGSNTSSKNISQFKSMMGMKRGSTIADAYLSQEKIVDRYIQKQERSMILRMVGNYAIDFFCSISSILSLLSLLMMSFDTSGIINIFYVVFCLTFLYHMKNFALQKNWKFPYYLQTVLKPFVYFEI